MNSSLQPIHSNTVNIQYGQTDIMKETNKDEKKLKSLYTGSSTAAPSIVSNILKSKNNEINFNKNLKYTMNNY